MNITNDYESKRNSFLTIIFVIIVVITGIISNLYTYQLFSSNVKHLENKVATLQTQISALTDSLTNYNQTILGNISLTELYEKVKDSVVLIRGQSSQGSISGSGFAYYHNASKNSVIITNYHVVQDTVTVSVTFTNGHAYQAVILGSDVYADLAILSTEAPLEEFHNLSIVSSTLLDVGDFVIAVGNPYELIGTMTTGIVSQLGRAIPEEMAGGYSIANVIQISAPINPGNSGGPLLNSKGQVVGITFAIIEESTGVGFAIPSDTILREISWLVNGTEYPHSKIGVMGVNMDYEKAQEIGTTTTYGWLIVEVESLSPAAKAGLKTDDIILTIDDQIVISGNDISNYLEGKTSPGQTINIKVERGSQELIIPLVLGTR